MVETDELTTIAAVDEVKPAVQPTAFWIYLVMFVLSVSCTIFILYQFTCKPAVRNKINNQIILVVVICSFLQVKDQSSTSHEKLAIAMWKSRPFGVMTIV